MIMIERRRHILDEKLVKYLFFSLVIHNCWIDAIVSIKRLKCFQKVFVKILDEKKDVHKHTNQKRYTKRL